MYDKLIQQLREYALKVECIENFPYPEIAGLLREAEDAIILLMEPDYEY